MEASLLSDGEVPIDGRCVEPMGARGAAGGGAPGTGRARRCGSRLRSAGPLCSSLKCSPMFAVPGRSPSPHRGHAGGHAPCFGQSAEATLLEVAVTSPWASALFCGRFLGSDPPPWVLRETLSVT